MHWNDPSGPATVVFESIRRGLSQHSKLADRSCLRRRAGVTLIELLVVVGILTLLATLSLSTVKNLLKDQKVSQSTRLVQQYIETAKIRAITSRRPVAVFLERVGKVNPGAFDPASYTATRLSIGEVFPPYTGDLIDATGTLWDVDFTAANANSCRPADRHADQIRFNPFDVFSGLGTQTGEPGFVRAGDLIQFEGANEFFLIEDMTPTTPDYVSEVVQGSNGNTEFALTFFNPPRPSVYNNCGSRPAGLYSTKPPALPISATPMQIPSLQRPDADTPPTSKPPQRVRFRIYRRPTKSLVGAITLPRGTCIDMWASGTGRLGSAATGGPFVPPTVTLQNNEVLSPASYSRVAIVFDATGKPSGVFQDDKILATDGATTRTVYEAFDGVDLDAKLYLLVGRTDQINNVASRPQESESDVVLSNVLDPANSWISINPLTGLVTSSPVFNVPDSLVASYQASPTQANYAAIVNSARTFASVGVNDVQK